MALHAMLLLAASIASTFPLSMNRIACKQSNSSICVCWPTLCDDITVFTDVEQFQLKDGGWTSIPPQLGNATKFPNLKVLSLSRNQLTGPIPPELGNLVKLENLELDGNQLTGPIPPELGNLIALKDLILRDNQLTGPIPPELGNLVKLGNLIFYNNQLMGPIPPQLANLVKLEILWLDGNQLTGPIPPEIGKLTNLRLLGLADNQLTGPIPSEIPEHIEHCRIARIGGTNQFCGALPLAWDTPETHACAFVNSGDAFNSIDNSGERLELEPCPSPPLSCCGKHGRRLLFSTLPCDPKC